MNKMQAIALMMGMMYHGISKMWKNNFSEKNKTPIGRKKDNIFSLRKKMNTSKYRPK